MSLLRISFSLSLFPFFWNIATNIECWFDLLEQTFEKMRQVKNILKKQKKPAIYLRKTHIRL